MADKTITENNIIIEGKSFYSCTKHPATKGKYPSNKYELGISDFDIKSLDNQLEPYVKDDDGVNYIKVANTKYPFRMYDKDMNEYNEPVSIPNGTSIRVAFSIKWSEKWNKEYLSVEGIQVLDELVKYNPFD